MIEPTLHHVRCPGGALHDAESHRMAYWEWNATGQAQYGHVIVCVHGLTRQGHDFDVLAQQLSQHARVICPDVVGRGASDWLAEPAHYAIPQYVMDMQAMLQQVNAHAPIEHLDWLGTSMGGLIGMAIAGSEPPMLPQPIRKLLLNDIGPQLEWDALQRIASYVGKPVTFESLEAGAQALRELSAGFGPHTWPQWLELSRHMLRQDAAGRWQLHYDPAIARPMQGITQQQVLEGERIWWALYDQIRAQSLLVRGAQSDLISAQTAQAMAQRGPRAAVKELEGVGHAPTFVASEQVAIALDFFLGNE